MAEIGLTAGKVKLFLVGVNDQTLIVGALAYGNYGGKNWMGGEYSPPGSEPTQNQLTAPAADALDAIFQVHDIAYTTAQGPEDIRIADRQLVQGIENLKGTADWGMMRPEERVYANLAQAYFDPARAMIGVANNWASLFQMLAPGQCFPAGTAINLAGGSLKPIEELCVGESVLAFDASTGNGRGALWPARVTRLFEGVTDQWLELRPAREHEARAIDAGFGLLTVTPGHRFLTPCGDFCRIDAILAGDGHIVLAGGAVIQVTAERIVYSAETAHLYEEAEAVEYASAGGLALAPRLTKGWKTYNFEVEHFHTYVAGGVRVHNDSLLTLAAAAEEFAAIFGHEFDGSMEDIGAMMGAIVDGRISVYGDYVGALGDDRYTATFYDAVQNKIALSADAFGLTAATVHNGALDHVVQYDNDAAFAGEARSFSYAERWFTGHDFSAVNSFGFDAAGATSLALDIERTAFLGTTESGGSPAFFSYLPEFGPGYDFDAGTFDVGSEGMTFIGGGGDFGGDFGFLGDFEGGFGLGGFDPWSFDFGFDPIVFDWNGDGEINIRPRFDSTAYFDIDNDGFFERTAWVGPGDAFLVIDLGWGSDLGAPDGDITQGLEVAFAQWTQDPNDTDLQALATVFDGNHNGLLDQSDVWWGSFGIWVDANQNGVCNIGEMHTLDEVGITSVTLAADHSVTLLPDTSRIHGFGEYTRTNGTVGIFADATLSYDPVGTKNIGNALRPSVLSEDLTIKEIYNATLVPRDAGRIDWNLASEGLIAGPVDNHIHTTVNTPHTIYGGAGDDLIEMAAGDDIIDGASGADRIFAGGGSDTIYFDLSDTIIDGGSGYDTGIATSTSTVNMDLGSHALEAVISNSGNDTISANSSWAVYIDGRGGQDTLTGSAFGDILVGGAGNDSLWGLDGVDLLNGGDDADTLRGGLGSDVLVGGDGTDIAIFSGARSAYVLKDLGNNRVQVSGPEGIDTVSEIEWLQFDDRLVHWPTAMDVGEINWLEYIASYSDLRAAYGTNAAAGQQHFLNHGIFEGRQVTFDALRYIASYADLIATCGASRDAGATHYILFGQNEGRTIGFDPAAYLARNPAVQASLGNDPLAATIQYIQYGFNEGRRWADLTGGAGNDTLTAGPSNDTLSGGAGNDTLDGGAGTDSAVFSGARSAYTITPLSSTGVRVAGPDGTDTLTHVEKLVFADQVIAWSALLVSISALSAGKAEGSGGGTTPFTFAVSRDGDASGAATVSWQVILNDAPSAALADFSGPTSGTLTFNPWETSKLVSLNIVADAAVEPTEYFSVALSNAAGAFVDPSHASAFAQIQTDDVPMFFASALDLNGDGRGDILWFDNNSFVGVWEMNGNQILASPGIASAPSGGHIAATGDVNGDQRADILWVDNAGFVGVWMMNGNQILASPGIAPSPSGSRVAGMGDFNGDGLSDVLWISDSGFVGMWEMSGSQILASPGIGQGPAAARIAGVGDFNGDHFSDILWIDDSGFVGVWEMNGRQIIAAPGIAQRPSDSHIAGVGDFNGDHLSDILWVSDSGFVGVWEMNGSQILASPGIAPSPGSGAKVAEIADLNGDGRSDIVWYDNNGFVGMWAMNGSQILASPGIAPSPFGGHIAPDYHLT